MLRKIKDVVKVSCPTWLWKRASRVVLMIYHFRARERKASFGGKNESITFYVIKRTPPGAGLLSNYQNVIGHLMLCQEKGYEPIVDMLYTKTHYNEDKIVNGTWNAWEYYWDQPTAFTLEEVFQSKNVILSSGDAITSVPMPNDLSVLEPERLNKVFNITCTVPLNAVTLDYIDRQRPIEFKTKRILGVAARGTDYNKRVLGHPRQPTVKQLIEWTETRMINWKMDYIFLTTEEEETLEEFKRHFGERLLYTNRKRFSNYSSTDPWIPCVRFNRENDKYWTGLEYLTEMVLLSECHAFLGALNSGVGVALIWNNNQYEHREIIDLGVYDGK